MTLQPFRLFLLAGVLLASASTLTAQPTPTPLPNPKTVASESLSESIDAQIAAAEADDKMEEGAKASLLEILGRAKALLKTADEHRTRAQQYREAIENAPEQTRVVKEKLDSLPSEGVEVPNDATTESLSQRVATTTAELEAANTTLLELAEKASQRRTRLAEMPTLLAEAERELQTIRAQQTQPAQVNESPAELSARKSLLSAREHEVTARIDSLKKEQAAYIATAELLPLQQKAAEQQVKYLAAQLRSWQDALSEKQKAKARSTAEELSQMVDDLPEELQELAQSNIAVATQQSELISELSAAKQRYDEVQEAFKEVKAERKNSEERVEKVGLTDALGVMLREHKREFEAMRYKYYPRVDLRRTIQEHQLELYRMEDEIGRLDSQLEKSQTTVSDWDSTTIDWGRLSSAEAEWVLKKKRRKQLESASQVQNEILLTMLMSDTQRRELMQEIDRYEQMVDRHLFWTRSAPTPSMEELDAVPEVLEWMANGNNWRRAAMQCANTVRSRPLNCLILIAVTISLIYAKPASVRLLSLQAQKAHRMTGAFLATMTAFAVTVGLASVSPWTMGTLSFLLLAGGATHPFVQGLGYGLVVAALFIAARALLNETCRDNGLADAHFGWSETLRKHLRRHLTWYTPMGSALVFLLVMYHEHPDEMVRVAVSRFASTLLFVVTATFDHVILRNRSPIYVDLVVVNPESRIYRWRTGIWAVAVLLPLSFAGMSIAGYLETTFRLGRSLQGTFLLVVLMTLFLGLLSRWLMLQRRDVIRRKAEEGRQRRLEEPEEQGLAAAAREVGIVLQDDLETDLPKLDLQTRQTATVFAGTLAVVGLGFIWQDAVPALEFLNVEAWSLGTGESVASVTWLDVLYAAVGVGFLFFAAKNLPSTIELLVLSRSSLDAGAKYAITTLLRYALIVAGFVILLHLLRVPYKELGWLLAAASVGLGFGLQEIVANFVSGVILLLERPIRVGDVVTIDGTTGIVSRIKMRATTVTNWDRKELVIPNKDLITQKLLNWSLTNVINRLTIEVGVAYGTDPNRVREVLGRVVAEHPEVLSEPPPLINFDSFGDSSLNFVARFFLAKLDNRIEVTHQINASIVNAFKAEGIAIPFPQRDVSVRITTPDEQ